MRRAQLRRIFRVVNGGTPTSDPGNWDGEVAWATPVDLASVNGGLIASTDRTLTIEGLAMGSRLVPSGSLLVSTRAPIGYVAQCLVPMAFNQGCRGLVAQEEVDIRYYRYQLVSISERLGALGQGSTFVELSGDALAGVEVFTPPIETQRAIADYLDTETARIDALITKKQRMIGLLGDQRAVLTTAGVTDADGARERQVSGLSWIAEIPAHWRTAKLTLVATLGSGHTPSRSHPEWWVDCTIPWVTTGEVAAMRTDRLEFVSETREKISVAGMANSAATLHPAGTVVLCRTASAGYSAIMASDMATSQDFATWTCGPLLRPRYLLLCLRAMRGDLLGRLAMGSTHKTIYMPDIESLRIPLPPLEEQDVIIESTWQKLRRIDAIVDKLAAQIQLLREHRQALITATVTGELAVPGVAA